MVLKWNNDQKRTLNIWKGDAPHAPPLPPPSPRYATVITSSTP